MTQEEFNANIKYLEENDVIVGEYQLWDDSPFSRELELYTDKGGDMIINLECVDKYCLQDYIDSFNINEDVIQWWDNFGEKKDATMPYTDIRDHYNDIEDWLDRLNDICDGMPY